MRKFLVLGLIIVLSLAVLTGCGGDESVSNEGSDAVTAASLNITDEAVFKKSIAEDGKWIICTIEDLEFDEELVVEGEFYNKDNPSNDLYRKIAPYTQDDSHNVLDRYTITAPKMTIKSPNTRFQAGTFVGDIYVYSNGFSLSDARVEGNVYFASEELKASADISADSTVTGVVEVSTDLVAAASLNITDEAVFKKSITEDGKWIICTIEDLEFDEELVVEGEFYNKDNPSNDLYRKIAPYTQDDSHNVLDRYTITAPKMTIKSPNTRFQAGTFVGDIYVEADGFSLSDARVEGNVYFASDEYEASADISDDSTVTGDVKVQ